jgi:tripeptide aminopeptidase
MITKQALIDRFFRYIKIDTQSDPENEDVFPSTEKQWVLAKMLEKELIEMGMSDVSLDENCYIMATLPANVDTSIPVIGFIAHIDTSPDFSGTNVNPQIHENYNGGDIVLNAAENIILSPKDFEDLLLYKGQTLITTDGTTLLGADDKAGVTEIMAAMEYLLKHPEIKHGTIKIGFTPDEEVGKGAHMFDVAKFGAEWAYTMDGSTVGELEFENFNAAGAKLIATGKIVHPGYAKNKMINSMLYANEFVQALPAEEVPEKTSGYEGFYHLHSIKGDVERTELYYIIRDHDRAKFEARKDLFAQLAVDLNTKYGKKIFATEIKDQYYNMREKVEPVMHIVDIAEEAMKELNITPLIKAIRGGTDGSQLSYKGLPCPNIFAGGHNFHGRYEFVAAEAIEKATHVILKIVELTCKRYQKS